MDCIKIKTNNDLPSLKASKFVSGELTCKPGTICFNFLAVLFDSFALRNQPLQYAANRQNNQILQAEQTETN